MLLKKGKLEGVFNFHSKLGKNSYVSRVGAFPEQIVRPSCKKSFRGKAVEFTDYSIRVTKDDRLLFVPGKFQPNSWHMLSG